MGDICTGVRATHKFKHIYSLLLVHRPKGVLLVHEGYYINLVSCECRHDELVSKSLEMSQKYGEIFEGLLFLGSVFSFLYNNRNCTALLGTTK